MTILDKIVKKRKERLAESPIDIEKLKKEIKDMEKPLSFYDGLAKKGLSIIGEVKKASPSKGVIVEDFKPVEIAKRYDGNIEGMSVLTEPDFFLGKKEYLEDIYKKGIQIPLLRKDFIIDESQIYEARAMGASCILLIVAILNLDELNRFIDLAYSLDLDVLLETHDEKEMEIALKTKAKIIGINNRNLKDFSVSLDTTINLAKLVPKDRLVVSESGIFTGDDIRYLSKGRVDAILVGESFMRCDDIAEKAKEFNDAYED